MKKARKPILWLSVLAMLSTSTALAQTCAGVFTQEELDGQYKEFFDLNLFVMPEVDKLGRSEDVTHCRYLQDNETMSKKVFDMFTFIDASKYLLSICEHGVFVEIVAAPKYLVTHISQIGGECEPKFNPLNLGSYTIEFSKRNNELVKLYRMAE